MDEMTHKQAESLVAELMARDAADDLDRASGWTILCTCQEFGTISLVGYFKEPAAAIEYAERWGRELNADSPPGAGWTLDVKAVMPASPFPSDQEKES